MKILLRKKNNVKYFEKCDKFWIFSIRKNFLVDLKFKEAIEIKFLRMKRLRLKMIKSVGIFRESEKFDGIIFGDQQSLKKLNSLKFPSKIPLESSFENFTQRLEVNF